MGTRMSGSALLLPMLLLSLIAGEVLMLAAQEPQTTPPAPQTQATPQTPATVTDQADLSGAYAGTFNCDALGITGDTTLTITGNQFTTTEGKTGRIVASKTHGYTAVALQLGELSTGPTATAPTIVSLRARRSGDRLTLTPAAGSTGNCSFTPARAVARTRRSRQAPPAATGAEVANPATNETVMPMPAQKPSPNPTPNSSPTPTPEPSPEPNPVPTPTGTPMPAPQPTVSPAPSPTPTPSPSPSPSPSPR